jgi:hypothetical protein
MAEVVVTVGVLSVVGGFTAVAGVNAKRSAEIEAAKAGVIAIEDAVERYVMKRGRLPHDLDGDGIASTEEVFCQLAQWDCLASDFKRHDPWGGEYTVVLYRDYAVCESTRLLADGRPANDFSNGTQIFCNGPDRLSDQFVMAVESMDDVNNFGLNLDCLAGAEAPGGETCVPCGCGCGGLDENEYEDEDDDDQGENEDEYESDEDDEDEWTPRCRCRPHR